MERKCLKGVLLSLLALGSMVGAGTAQAGMGAFVDGQIQFTGNDKPTFAVNDAAVYISHETEVARFYADIPLSLLVVGVMTTAQFYAWHKYDMGASWMLGRWDTIFGFEGNDSKDVFFTSRARLSALLPTTHNGLLIGCDLGEAMGVKLYSSNAEGATTRVDDNLEFGGQFFMKGDMNVRLGGYMHKHAGAAKTSMLIDVGFGMKFGDLAMDLAVDALQQSAGDMGFGVLGNFIYAMDAKWSFGARVEFLSKMANALLVGNHSLMQVTAGPNVKMTDNLTAKVDYTFNSTTAVSGGASASSHGGAIGAVYAF